MLFLLLNELRLEILKHFLVPVTDKHEASLSFIEHDSRGGGPVILLLALSLVSTAS